MPRIRSHSSGTKNDTLEHGGGIMGSISRFWHRSYAAEYIGFLLLLTGYMFILTIAEPFHRMFSLDNIAIQFPHTKVERVPVRYNILYSGIIPLTIILISTLLIHLSSTPNRYHKAHVSALGLLISLILTSFITDVIKNAVGRPRPDLLARCKPAKGTPAQQLVTIDVCTEKDHHVLHDGWRSFPSGHTGQLHVFLPRTDLFRVLLALAPLIAAALIAISRCEDYRHDVYDVTVGSILGILIANFSYRRYYPSLKTRQCDKPFPSRAQTTVMEDGMGKRNDEEARIGALDDEGEQDSERAPLRRSSSDKGRVA
ncbi:MAG: hypothetical protein Q9213_002662 [Squamulea squamosa]